MMKKSVRLIPCLSLIIFLTATICSAESAPRAAKSPIDPCLDCHSKETAKIVAQWESGKHSKTGVKCYVCHFAEADNPEGMEHNTFFIVTEVDVSTCESCHPENGAELLKKFSGKDSVHP